MKPITPSEDAVQRAIIDMLAHCLAGSAEWLHIANKPRTPIQGRREKFLGAKSGTPDLLIVADGRAYWMEVKRHDGRVSVEQVKMHARLRRAGCPVALVRSVDDAYQALAAWGLLRRNATFHGVGNADLD